MTECDFCGDGEKSLNAFTHTCPECSILYGKLGDMLKSSKKANKIDNVKKMLVSLFADAEVYVSIEGN